MRRLKIFEHTSLDVGCKGQIVPNQHRYASKEMRGKVRCQVLAVSSSSRRLAEANSALRWHIIANALSYGFFKWE
jgi:hypothetical protein